MTPSRNGPYALQEFEETPVGIEPTSTGLQPVAWPSGSSAVVVQNQFGILATNEIANVSLGALWGRTQT